ncbi:MAG: M20/M25/M40 family metallo-hydrolase [Labilithrix sp.]|nr:M20/M25/M40 family metallo-hydrolase [Labilithrix sp.]MBX3221475.1 M20/M25/M40 family metallo-hydrolase [Labilithrix sp.]
MKPVEHDNDARRTRSRDQERAREKARLLGLEETVDAAGEDSFPASDPPSWSPTHLGGPAPTPARREPEMFHDVVQRIRDDVRLFSEAIGERNDRSAAALQSLARAADAIEGRFRDAGAPVRRRRIDEAASNVEAVLRGVLIPEESVIVGAHYDTSRGSPGADDNASGVAMLLALARSLSAVPLHRTVRLVAFAAEEAPHTGTATTGSRHYLDDLRREGPRVTAMMNIDAVGVYVAEPHRWPFRLMRLLRSDLAIVGDRGTRWLLERVKRAFDSADADVTSAIVTHPFFFTTLRAQSHHAFAREGIPAFMVTDTGPLRSLDYHRATDTADRLDYDRLGRTSVALERIVLDLAGSARAPL